MVGIDVSLLVLFHPVSDSFLRCIYLNTKFFKKDLDLSVVEVLSLPEQYLLCIIPLQQDDFSYTHERNNVFVHTGRVSDMFVQVQLWSDGRPLCLPSQTQYHPFGSLARWNEWITLPVRYGMVGLFVLCVAMLFNV